ncbi:hypothetical protein [Brevundimonas sp.]|jgi:hypothetical protein|uniref:hypothetical protein n=1 Tax=Brevundimonas sp. TaxID=1871086 RepID=UPI0028A8189A|nr:hypothetical protein [Brevundimonas sp.]
MRGTTTGPRLDWRKAGFAATAVGLNAGAVVLLSMTDVGLRVRPPRAVPMIVYLDDAWPTLARAPKTPSDLPLEEKPAAPRRAQASQADAPDSSGTATSPRPPLTEATTDDGIDARWRVDGAVPGPRVPLLSCDAPHRLSSDARRRCEDRWAGAEAVAVIRGTGDAERDAAFARQGARRLAAWEAQRAEPSRVNRSCENPNPVAGCADVDIRIELFSSRDGFLPNLRKRRE